MAEELKEMHGLLEQMIQAAKDRRKDELLKLDGLYETLLQRVYSKLDEPLRLEYDNCRKSCVTAVTMLPHLYESLISDSEERFSKLPKPKC